MAKLIGIDTGGTYTDAVLFSESDGVLAKAKALTTKDDLSIGIGEAIDAVIQTANVPPAEVALVSMSTTLATNAIVEGLGNRVGLILVGFERPDLNRAGLGEALRGDPVLILAGGHDAHGSEAAALDFSPALPRASGGWSDRSVAVGNQELFLEMTITATGTGRPSLAHMP